MKPLYLTKIQMLSEKYFVTPTSGTCFYKNVNLIKPISKGKFVKRFPLNLRSGREAIKAANEL